MEDIGESVVVGGEGSVGFIDKHRFLEARDFDCALFVV
jgi:hypothetical protein